MDLIRLSANTRALCSLWMWRAFEVLAKRYHDYKCCHRSSYVWSLRSLPAFSLRNPSEMVSIKRHNVNWNHTIRVHWKYLIRTVIVWSWSPRMTRIFVRLNLYGKCDRKWSDRFETMLWVFVTCARNELRSRRSWEKWAMLHSENGHRKPNGQSMGIARCENDFSFSFSVKFQFGCTKSIHYIDSCRPTANNSYFFVRVSACAFF